jgi:integrase
VLIALTTGMRIAMIFGLSRSDGKYEERVIAVRARLKTGKVRYVPMTPELATERYAKLAKTHIAKTGDTARELWKLMECEQGGKQPSGGDVRVLFARLKIDVFGRQ